MQQDLIVLFFLLGYRHAGKVSVKRKTLNVKQQTVIVFDDIISTGGTIVASVKVLRELDVQKIFVACVHPLLIGDAERQILESGVEEIIGTDSVPSNVSKVSIASLLTRDRIT